MAPLPGDSRDSGYRMDRQWTRGETHGNALLTSSFHSDIEARPSAGSVEGEGDEDLKREESVESAPRRSRRNGTGKCGSIRAALRIHLW